LAAARRGALEGLAELIDLAIPADELREPAPVTSYTSTDVSIPLMGRWPSAFTRM
jgi:hypothetical protein